MREIQAKLGPAIIIRIIDIDEQKMQVSTTFRVVINIRQPGSRHGQISRRRCTC